MNNNFPSQIPIFPLSGVIYFPKSNLPLNIFEQRYLDLVNDSFNKDKFMGMVQSKKNGNDIYKVGCLGKIIDFQENEDGRVLINLKGVTRFEIVEELKTPKLYREFKVDYKKFDFDIKPALEDVFTESLMDKCKVFFKKSGLMLNWKEFDKLNKFQKINTLAMIAPISNEEKQTILEAVRIDSKTKILSEIIEFYLHEQSSTSITLQ